MRIIASVIVSFVISMGAGYTAFNCDSCTHAFCDNFSSVASQCAKQCRHQQLPSTCAASIAHRSHHAKVAIAAPKAHPMDIGATITKNTHCDPLTSRSCGTDWANKDKKYSSAYGNWDWLPKHNSN
jgi:hypothetical protein